jgi:hypothetical protein
MLLAASSAPVAVKHTDMDPVYTVKIFPVLVSLRFTVPIF